MFDAGKGSRYDGGAAMENAMTYHAMTSLAEIREQCLPIVPWQKLLAHLGKTKADNEPLHLLTVLDVLSVGDFLWCTRAKSHERLSRHFQAWFAEYTLRHVKIDRPTDQRVLDQISMLRNDDATDAQRIKASTAAWDAFNEADGGLPWAIAWGDLEREELPARWRVASALSNGVMQGPGWAAASVAVTKAQKNQLRAMIGPA